jgi:hypothetical protein
MEFININFRIIINTLLINLIFKNFNLNVLESYYVILLLLKAYYI